LSRADWENLRRSRLTGREIITVELQDLRVNFAGPDKAQVKFSQIYRSNVYRDVTRKTLDMVLHNGQWQIVGEVSVPCTGNTTGGCR
jgi:adhesin transport system outer membrane protein